MCVSVEKMRLFPVTLLLIRGGKKELKNNNIVWSGAAVILTKSLDIAALFYDNKIKTPGGGVTIDSVNSSGIHPHKEVCFKFTEENLGYLCDRKLAFSLDGWLEELLVGSELSKCGC